MTSTTNSLQILLLGGFDVWSDGEQLRGFESQKVRALLAYLALHRGRALSREHLAGLFWGDRDPESARRNLRQAIYNLKATLPGEDGARPHLLVDSQTLRFDRDSDGWIDVEAFERAVGLQRAGASGGFRDLVAAAQLYRGDLLAGFLVRDCPEFEEWLITEQERLRALALEALRTLAEGCLARGEYRAGIGHARRLVAMDPLSEAAHRQLLRLYELGGQRSRALAHYDELRELLRRELAVEPLPETRALHEAILADALRTEGAAEPPATAGPIVPLVGRGEPLARLAESWQAVLAGDLQVTLVTGEEGIGTTRLVRSFVDSVSSRRRVRVLAARGREQFPQASGGVLAEALRQALPDGDDGPGATLAALPVETRRELSLLLPELAASAGTAPHANSAGTALRANSAGTAHHEASAGSPSEATGAQLAESVAGFLQQLARVAPGGEAEGEPVVLLLDDLHLADRGTQALVLAMTRWLPGSRVWILATARLDGLAPEHPLRTLAARDGDGVAATIELVRLSPEDLAEAARALLDPEDVEPAAALFAVASAGLPLALVTLVHSLWDAGDLVSDETGRWRFRGGAARWQELAPHAAPESDTALDTALLRRIRRLPSSTRRLATMAAVIGPRFDTELLAAAEDEHPAVVELGLALLLERWLVRQQRERWNPQGLESTTALWSRGARRGAFLFDPPRLRRVLYESLNPLRRQVLHRQVAEAMIRLHPDDLDAIAEDLAHHLLAAGDTAGAGEPLRRAARRAAALADPASAAEYEARAGHREADAAEGDSDSQRNLARWPGARRPPGPASGTPSEPGA